MFLSASFTTIDEESATQETLKKEERRRSETQRQDAEQSENTLSSSNSCATRSSRRPAYFDAFHVHRPGVVNASDFSLIALSLGKAKRLRVLKVLRVYPACKKLLTHKKLPNC